MVVYFMIALA